MNRSGDIKALSSSMGHFHAHGLGLVCEQHGEREVVADTAGHAAPPHLDRKQNGREEVPMLE